MLQEIGLTDYYFKELLKKSPRYLLLLINGICNLNLKETDITFGDTEERDSVTFKTINYDIKVVSQNLHIDIEAQKRVVSSDKNDNNDYSYDIQRVIYYLCMLHSRSYEYREKGYVNKRSIVIFIYQYDIEGNEVIQKTNLHNASRNVEYDDIILYSVSLAKISKDSILELERALKLLSETDLEEYKNDKSAIVREAANVLEGYDKSEIAAMIRDQKKKEELEQRMIYQTGVDKGAQLTLEDNIRKMSKKGFDNETIANTLDLDINYVKEVLAK